MKQVANFAGKVIDFSTPFSKNQNFQLKSADALKFSGYTNWGLFFLIAVKKIFSFSRTRVTGPRTPPSRIFVTEIDLMNVFLLLLF